MKNKQLWDAAFAAERANPTTMIRFTEDAVPPFMKYAKRKTECFFVMTLNGSHGIIKVREVTRGTLNRTIVHPREIFRPAIMDRAASIIVGHNHPSGSPIPSEEDKDVTKKLIAAGGMLGIAVLDHIIVSTGGYYSFTYGRGNL